MNFSKLFIKISYWACPAIILLVGTQIIARLFFQKHFIALDELQWHFYAFFILIGIVSAEKNNRHVRVDLFYRKLRPETQNKINLFGTLFFFIPFFLVLFYHSLPFVWDSFQRNERSLNPAGLPYRWIVKSLIPFSILLLCSIKLKNFLKEKRNSHDR